MTTNTIAELKAFFETADVPTAAQFSEWIDRSVLYDNVKFFGGILRPSEGTGGDAGTTVWSFINDSAHTGGVFLDAPTINVSEVIEMAFSEQVDKIITAWICHDGVISAYHPGLSINTTTVSVSLQQHYEAWTCYRMNRTSGVWNRSFIETPTAALDTSYDTMTVTETTNTIEIDTVKSYLGYPVVQVDDGEFLIRQDYVGSSNYPTKIRIRKMDFDGTASNWSNGDAILINRRASQGPTIRQVDASSADLYALTNANYWLGGFVQLN